MSHHKHNKHSRPNVGDIIVENERRGAVIAINNKEGFIWTKFEHIQIPIPIFSDQLRILGLEKKGQVVWETIIPEEDEETTISEEDEDA